MLRPAMLCLALVVVGAAVESSKPVELRFNFQKDLQSDKVGLVMGQKAQVELVSNPSTGYRWFLDNDGSAADANGNNKIVDFSGGEYEAANSEIVGAPGKQVFTFTGSQLGDTTVDLVYRRPWEQNALTGSSRVMIQFSVVKDASSSD